MTPPSPIRVLIIDDNRIVLWGLERLIDGERPRMEVVGKATSFGEAIALANTLRPDVIVLAVNLAHDGGFDIIPQLVANATSVLVLTGLRDLAVHQRAMLAGARGIVHKEQAPDTMLKAIERVHQGEVWLDRATTGRIFLELSRTGNGWRSNSPRKENGLTARERELIGQLATNLGANYRTIAGNLQISERTVRNHLTHIYRKLGVQNRGELLAYASKKRILPRS
jgi:two-component system, NarL family, nitrate/nitrite response regulator NarL